MTDKTMKVFPSPKLEPLSYVPGVGIDGAELPLDKAKALLEAGLVVTSKAAAKPKATPKPKATKTKPKSEAPAEPAQSEDKP